MPLTENEKDKIKLKMCKDCLEKTVTRGDKSVQGSYVVPGTLKASRSSW